MSHLPSIYYFEARLAGQRPQEICLSFPLQYWDYKHRAPYPYWVFDTWVLKTKLESSYFTFFLLQTKLLKHDLFSQSTPHPESLHLHAESSSDGRLGLTCSPRGYGGTWTAEDPDTAPASLGAHWFERHPPSRTGWASGSTEHVTGTVRADVGDTGAQGFCVHFWTIPLREASHSRAWSR